jgi:capsule polysaccharide export protein KpsE/RkpR
MATLRQIEANRLNAQKSTGPRTPQGKAVSSQNALKSGLDAESQFVTGEDRIEFAQLQNEYIARFQPLTPEERFQVDTLLRSEWILRRLFRAEAQLWEYHAIRADRSEGVPLGEALVAGNEVFRRLQRRITLAERSYKDAFAELERLQRARRSLAGGQIASRPDHPTSPHQPPATDRTESGSFLHPSVASEPPRSHSDPARPTPPITRL